MNDILYVDIDINYLKQDLEKEYTWWNTYLNNADNFLDIYKIFLLILNSSGYIEIANNLQKHFNSNLNSLNDKILGNIGYRDEVIFNNRNQVEQTINKFSSQLQNLLLITNQNISANKLSYYINNIDHYLEIVITENKNITRLLLDKADINIDIEKKYK